MHKFFYKDCFFAADTESGSVHAVDGAVYDLLTFAETGEDIPDDLINKYGKTTVDEAMAEMRRLQDEGMLFSKDVYGDLPHRLAGSPVVKALCMHMAHDCNLRCGYCFAAGGSFAGERRLMSFDTAKMSIDFLINNSGNRKNLEVDFFGGEPLLNFDVIKQTVAYARGIEDKHNKKFNFTLTTNGVLLNDEIISYVNEHMYNIVLSLDGRKKTHDTARKTPDGGGSYETVVPLYTDLLNKRGFKNYYVRGTFTADNLDFCEDALHLNALGFKRMSIEPVVAPNGSPFAINESHLETVYAQYDTLCEKMLEADAAGDGFDFFHFNIDLSGGPCVYKRLAGCGAGLEYLAVTPSGELYPCHQLAGSAEYLLGSVNDGITNKKARDVFSNSGLYSKEKCRNCWAKFICAGGCAANAININSCIDEPYETGCKLMKKRAECAIYYNFRSKGNNP